MAEQDPEEFQRDLVAPAAPARDEAGRWLPGCKSPNVEGGAISSYPRDWRELRALACSHAPEAVEKLVEIMRTGRSKKLQMAAALALLDRGFGRPAEMVEVLNNLHELPFTGFDLARRIAWMLDPPAPNPRIEADAESVTAVEQPADDKQE